MHDQPKYIPLRASTFFADGRSERSLPAGVVARGADHLREDTYFYTGKINNVEGNFFPFPITRADLERGQNRFNIYCTPCHSRLGDGKGMIVQRGFKQAADYADPKLLNAPVGHFYDVMSNGFGAMPDYSSQLAPRDRWRIAAYLRVLQLSRHATLADVPAEMRGSLKATQGIPPTLGTTDVTPGAEVPPQGENQPR